MAPQKRGLDYVIGLTAASTIAANSQASMGVIRNNVASTFYYDRIAIRYAAALNTAQIRMLDTQFNRDVISGNTQLCILGQPNNSAFNVPWFALKNIQILSPGQAVEVFIQTFATVVNANDISIALVGYYLM